MSKQTLLELATRVRHKLEESFPRIVSGDNLHSLCEVTERFLLETISNEILQEIALAAKRKNLAFTVATPSVFQYGTSVYELRIGLAAASNILEVVIDPRRSDQQLMGSPIQFRIEANGRVKDVRIHLSIKFEAKREAIGAIVKTVLETGYRLLGAQIENGIEEIQKWSAHELYGHVRGLLAPELVRSIKFNAIVDSTGVYLLDREAFNNSVKAAEEHSLLTCRSALDVVSDVCTTLVPFDQMFSKEALVQDTSIEANLMRAKYSSTGIHISEMAIYGSTHALVQPLARNDKTSLVASYPSVFRSQIEPVLTSERTRFEQLTKQHTKGLINTLEHIAGQSKRPIRRALESGATLLGTFSGAYSAELLHHLR